VRHKKNGRKSRSYEIKQIAHVNIDF